MITVEVDPKDIQHLGQADGLEFFPKGNVCYVSGPDDIMREHFDLEPSRECHAFFDCVHYQRKAEQQATQQRRLYMLMQQRQMTDDEMMRFNRNIQQAQSGDVFAAPDPRTYMIGWGASLGLAVGDLLK